MQSFGERVMAPLFRNIIAVSVLLLPAAVWLIGRAGPTSPIFESAPRNPNLFVQLGIEPLGQNPAPDFVLKDLAGNAVRLHDLKGKVVLLNFWATWCPTCRFEMPSMESLHKELGPKGLVILAVALRESAVDVQPVYREHDLTFTALLDGDARASELYDIWSLPTTFVINKQGSFVGKVIGYRDWNSGPSRKFIAQLLKESA